MHFLRSTAHLSPIKSAQKWMGLPKSNLIRYLYKIRWVYMVEWDKLIHEKKEKERIIIL